jgi:hypothetical protein
MDINDSKHFCIIMTCICFIMTIIIFYNFTKNKDFLTYKKHNFFNDDEYRIDSFINDDEYKAHSFINNKFRPYSFINND